MRYWEMRRKAQEEDGGQVRRREMEKRKRKRKRILKNKTMGKTGK
jgi:hypothetical protein